MLRLRKDVVNISATVAHLEHEHFVLEVSLRGSTWYPVASGAQPRVVGRAWKLEVGEQRLLARTYHYDVAEGLRTAWQQVRWS